MKTFDQPNGTAERGFTIIELMIATTVLATILLVVTIVMTSIGNLYYKGVNQSRTQDTARNITDEFVQQLQLNGSPTIPGTTTSTNPLYASLGMHAVCIGATRYSYVVGWQLNNNPAAAKHQISHVLWRDTISISTSCPVADLTATNPSTGTGPIVNGVATDGINGTELLLPNSRLTALDISTTSPYQVSLAVAYGDDDLLCDANTMGDCGTVGTSASVGLLASGTIPAGYQIVCKGSTGERFCATASLKTTAVQRLH